MRRRTQVAGQQRHASRHSGLLLLTAVFAGLCWCAAGVARAADPAPPDPSPDPWAFVPASERGTAPSGATASGDVEARATDDASIDWSLLNDTPEPPKPSGRRPKAAAGAATADAWTRNERPDGSSAVTVKQSLVPLWDTHVGADFNVGSPSPWPTPLPEKLATPSPSSSAAWATATAPGFGAVWDKTALEARLDPAQDQGKLGTSISKSIALDGPATTLSLQGGYSITDPAALPLIAQPPRTQATTSMDQSAKLQFGPSGTSLIAGQTLSSTEERWLKSVGAEQALFGDITLSGGLSETAAGGLSKRVAAGFHKTW